MSVNIHGKEYITVAERLLEAKDNIKSISTEVLYQTPVVIKATVVTDKGSFTGISAANESKAIEKMSPYEVAETSAVGRALGFAGFGIVDGIATADEMVKAEPNREVARPYYSQSEQKVINPIPASEKQVGLIAILLKQKGQTDESIYEKYNITSKKELSKVQASQVIDNLSKLPSVEEYDR